MSVSDNKVSPIGERKPQFQGGCLPEPIPQAAQRLDGITS
jgi:hypothetical protein